MTRDSFYEGAICLNFRLLLHTYRVRGMYETYWTGRAHSKLSGPLPVTSLPLSLVEAVSSLLLCRVLHQSCHVPKARGTSVLTLFPQRKSWIVCTLISSSLFWLTETDPLWPTRGFCCWLEGKVTLYMDVGPSWHLLIFLASKSPTGNCLPPIALFCAIIKVLLLSLPLILGVLFTMRDSWKTELYLVCMKG